MRPPLGEPGRLVIARNLAVFLTIVFLLVFLMMLANDDTSGLLVGTGILAAGSFVAFVVLFVMTGHMSLEEVVPPPSPTPPPSRPPRQSRRSADQLDAPPPDYRTSMESITGPPPSYSQAMATQSKMMDHED